MADTVPNTRASKAERLAYLDRYVRERHDGRCVSTEYTTHAQAHRFECRAGHRFDLRPRQITQYNAWCKDCERDARLAALDAEVRKRHGGRCIAEAYTRQSARHWFECAEGHVFEATPANVLHRDSWCPSCAGNARLEIEPFELLAELHGGALVSPPARISRDSRLKCRCARGHHFTLHVQNYSQLHHGWCHACVEIERREASYERIVTLACELEYTVLSTEYQNARTPVEFRCQDGHYWRARSYDFLGGRRCAQCIALGGDRTLRRQRRQA